MPALNFNVILLWLIWKFCMQSWVLYFICKIILKPITGILNRDMMTDVGGIRLPIKKCILTIFIFLHIIYYFLSREMLIERPVKFLL